MNMVWLLLVVYLGGDPASIRQGEIAQTFTSPKACEERIREIENQLGPDRNPYINMDCIVYKKRAI